MAKQSNIIQFVFAKLTLHITETLHLRNVNTENLQGHHIKSFKDYPELRLAEDNVTVLCRVCNLQIGDKSIKDW